MKSLWLFSSLVILIASTLSAWPSVSLRLNPVEVCALLSSPGDIYLNTDYYVGDPNSATDQVLYHVIDPLGLAGSIVDLLNARDPIQKFSHTAFVSEIDLQNPQPFHFQSWFLGPMTDKDSGSKGYNRDFSVVRAKGGVEVNSHALYISKHLSNDQMGSYCSDVVNELFDGRFSNQSAELGKNLSGLDAVL